MKKILIIGATSAMAEETARCFADEGDQLALVARSQEKLDALKADLTTRGAKQVDTYVMDALDTEKHAAVLQRIWNSLGGIDTVLIAHGSLSVQEAGQEDFALVEKELQTNFLSVVSLLTPLANLMAKQKSGTIGVISSVAGLRGRQSNYIYGAAKGGLNIFLQGLRNRLAKDNVAVVTLLPGFVSTPMTAHLDQGPLFASAKSVGRGIYKALRAQKNVVYLPFFWRWIMLIIRLIPEGIFKKLNL